MKSALFSKLSLAPLLVAAGMSGCGDTGNGTGSSGQGICENLTINVCECAPGVTGVQRCENSTWGLCNCGAPTGTGGTPPFGAGGAVPPGGARCGDGVITPPEQCDGQAQNGQTCQSASMYACSGGTLICNGNCAFDLSMCTGCMGNPGGAGGQMGTGGTFGAGGSVGGTTGQP